MCAGPWNPCPIWLPTIPHSFPYFFLILWLFYCYFSFSIAILSIFGNVHWTLNTMPNMVTNHPLFLFHFFLIFSLFYCYFSFSIATISIFENVRWTLNTQCPIWSPTIPHFFSYFFLIFSLFYLVFAGPVQSGFLPQKRATVDRNRSRTNPDIEGTEPNHLGPVFCGPWCRLRPV